MKGVLIKIEVVVLLVLLVILGIKVFQFIGIQNKWSDEIFERTEGGDYLLTQTSAISDSKILQKYEGTVVSKGISFRDNVQLYTFELESALNTDKTVMLEIPSNILLGKDSIGIIKMNSDSRELYDSNRFAEFIESVDEGDFISVETINEMDYELNVLKIDTFTLVDIK